MARRRARHRPSHRSTYAVHLDTRGSTRATYGSSLAFAADG